MDKELINIRIAENAEAVQFLSSRVDELAGTHGVINTECGALAHILRLIGRDLMLLVEANEAV